MLVVVARMISLSLPDRGTAVGAAGAAEGTPVAWAGGSAGRALSAHAVTTSSSTTAAACKPFCTTAHNGRRRNCWSSIGRIAEVQAEALRDLLIQPCPQRFEAAHEIVGRRRQMAFSAGRSTARGLNKPRTQTFFHLPQTLPCRAMRYTEFACCAYQRACRAIASSRPTRQSDTATSRRVLQARSSALAALDGSVDCQERPTLTFTFRPGGADDSAWRASVRGSAARQAFQPARHEHAQGVQAPPR